MQSTLFHHSDNPKFEPVIVGKDISIEDAANLISQAYIHQDLTKEINPSDNFKDESYKELLDINRLFILKFRVTQNGNHVAYQDDFCEALNHDQAEEIITAKWQELYPDYNIHIFMCGVVSTETDKEAYYQSINYKTVRVHHDFIEWIDSKIKEFIPETGISEIYKTFFIVENKLI